MNIEEIFVTAAGLSTYSTWMIKTQDLKMHMQIAMHACELRGAELHVVMSKTDNHVRIIGNGYDVLCCFDDVDGIPNALIQAVDMMVKMQPYVENENVVEFKRNG